MVYGVTNALYSVVIRDFCELLGLFIIVRFWEKITTRRLIRYSLFFERSEIFCFCSCLAIPALEDAGFVQ